MDDLSDLFKKDETTIQILALIKEQFQLELDPGFGDLGYKFETFHLIRNLLDGKSYYSIGIDQTELNFQDRNGLLEVLVKFIDQQIAEIPNESEALEKERMSARYWDDIQHYQETEALSAKDGTLNKIKTKLLKELNKENKVANRKNK